MNARTLKTFQEQAVTHGLAVFQQGKAVRDAAKDDESTSVLAHQHHSCLLIEAPTGAGKTIMAGHIVERFSQVEGVVWFWFAPFKGVVGQTADFLRGEFAGLRLRELQTDRTPEGVKAGDVYVSTWQTVATRLKDRRNVRRPGELLSSVDQLVDSIRAQGLRLGVVVDEAHHGFGKSTLAGQFFKEVLKPEYTILITATPDDAEVIEFQNALGGVDIARNVISRIDAVAAGLVKDGIRCVAYLVDEAQQNLVDLERMVLRDATAHHRQVKETLAGLGVNLVPLMLVQVDSSAGVQRAREHLLAAGFTENQIAVHTAEEPDAGLLGLANDELREVLIFKMAVALGFDAPRAFTLASMRSVKDEDFGVQLVGRILRVHRRLHARAVAGTLPESLRHGYVFLADFGSQAGIEKAGERINKVRTEYAQVSPATLILKTSDGVMVQTVAPNGQIQLLRVPEPPAWVPTVTGADNHPPADHTKEQDLFLAGETLPPDPGPPGRDYASVFQQQGSTAFRYRIKEGAPRKFKTESLCPDPEITEQECANHFAVSAMEVMAAMKAEVKIVERSVEIFSRQMEMKYPTMAPDPRQTAWSALKALQKNPCFDPRRLKAALLLKLGQFLEKEKLGENAPAEVERLLNLLLATHPQLLDEARDRAQAAHIQIEDAASLPEYWDEGKPLPPSPLNLYGCMPTFDSTWESSFVHKLDSDPTGKILWWHRNLDRKPWSIAAVLPNGDNFYPDFIIGVKGRNHDTNGLLADTKWEFDSWRQKAKSNCTHKAYGRVLIVSRDQQDQWRTVAYNPVREVPEMAGPMSILDWDRF
jgi:hypothetical protein